MMQAASRSMAGRFARSIGNGCESNSGWYCRTHFCTRAASRNNLLVGRSDAGLADIEQVCVDANIHDSVTGFSEGYQTQVGERGVTLSGGQRQRLALARALLKDPPVLVLDDSLSAVDSGTELRILRALEGRKGRSTTIVIAHRLSSIRHADRIVVLAAGAIVQQGTHAELASQQGPYRALYAIQQSLDAGIEVDLGSRVDGLRAAQ